MNSRRNAIRNLFSGTLAAGTGGLFWGATTENLVSSELALRPPGALEEDKFVSACIKCGQCAEACPYDTLTLADAADGMAPGTPQFKPRDIPCYMCTNIPCTKACPSGALSMDTLLDKSGNDDINKSKMGLAVIHRESCIAYEGIQCDACYRACPLMGEAITLEMETNTYTNRHANLLPVVHSDVCTGCGVCEHACVVEKASIFILPREHSTGKLGDHYIRSWNESSDAENVKGTQGDDRKDKDIESAIDYLNDDEELFE